MRFDDLSLRSKLTAILVAAIGVGLVANLVFTGVSQLSEQERAF